MSTPKKQQHYVPKSLLNNFCEGTKKQLYALFKDKREIAPVSTNNIAKSSYLYNSMLDDDNLSALKRFFYLNQPLSQLVENNKLTGTSLEDWLEIFENRAIAIIRKINTAADFKMNANEKQLIILYTIGMKGRIKPTRDRIRSNAFAMSMDVGFADLIFPLLIASYFQTEFNPQDFLILVVRTESEAFCISDAPALEQVNIRGISIGTFMPISPLTAIGITCNSDAIAKASETINLQDQGSITINDKEVGRLNLLQVKNSNNGIFFMSQEQAYSYLQIIQNSCDSSNYD